MAGNRIDLHNKFIDILGTKGQAISRVYFQPPATVQLSYPCIIYKRSSRKDFFSNDLLYLGMNRYAVTIIDKNPDSLIPEKVRGLPYCAFSAHYAADGLNHDTFTLYF